MWMQGWDGNPRSEKIQQLKDALSLVETPYPPVTGSSDSLTSAGATSDEAAGRASSSSTSDLEELETAETTAANILMNLGDSNLRGAHDPADPSYMDTLVMLPDDGIVSAASTATLEDEPQLPAGRQGPDEKIEARTIT